MKILLMSGLHNDTVVLHGIQEEGTAFLQKPFTRIAACKVRNVLDVCRNPEDLPNRCRGTIEMWLAPHGFPSASMGENMKIKIMAVDDDPLELEASKNLVGTLWIRGSGSRGLAVMP